MSGPVVPGLRAALLLARGRTEGIAPPATGDVELARARHSFVAALFCLPFFIGLRLIDIITAKIGDDPGRASLPWADLDWSVADARAMAITLCGFVIGWAGFAIASHRFAARIGRAALWPRFIALWNWCNLVQYGLLAVAAVIGLAALPWWAVQTAALVALGWALWLEWFMTRFALAIPGLLAVALVALDVAIGMTVTAIVG